MSQRKNTSAAIARTDRLLLSVTKTVLSYPGKSELNYSVVSAEARIKDIVDDVMSSRYLPGQSRSSCVRYVRFGPLMTKSGNVSPLLESLNECLKDDKKTAYITSGYQGGSCCSR